MIECASMGTFQVLEVMEKEKNNAFEYTFFYLDLTWSKMKKENIWLRSLNLNRPSAK